MFRQLIVACIALGLSSALWAQSTQPALEGKNGNGKILDGAILSLDAGGTHQQYRLIAQNLPERETPVEEINFNILPSTLMAPASVFVNGDPIFARFDPLRCLFYWNFGDPTGRRNDLMGFNAAHTYDRPGDYVITLWVVDPQYVVTTFQQKITIRPDTRKVITVSSDGSDTNTGAPGSPVRSFAAALGMAKSDCTVQFRRGDTFDIPTSTHNLGTNLVISDFGDLTQPRPVLRYTGSEPTSHIFPCNDKTLGFFVQNVTFDSIQTTNTDKPGTPDCVVGAGQNITIRDCTFLNVNYGYNGNGLPRGMMMIGCDAPLETGVRAYAAWVQGRDTVLLDNTVINSTREHAVRATKFEHLLVCGNRLGNLDRKSVDPYDIKKGALTLQRGNYVYVRGNELNGPIALGPLGKADGFKADAPDATQSRQLYAVVENNQLNGDALELHHGLEHAVIRSNGIRVNDGRAIEIDGFDTQYNRGCSDLVLLNNVAINKGTVGGFLLTTGKVEGVELGGNHYIAPNLQVGKNRAAVLFITEDALAGFTSVHDNVWATGKPIPFARGGAIYLGSKWPEVSGFVSPENWGKVTGVHNDQFESGETP